MCACRLVVTLQPLQAFIPHHRCCALFAREGRCLRRLSHRLSKFHRGLGFFCSCLSCLGAVANYLKASGNFRGPSVKSELKTNSGRLCIIALWEQLLCSWGGVPVAVAADQPSLAERRPPRVPSSAAHPLLTDGHAGQDGEQQLITRLFLSRGRPPWQPHVRSATLAAPARGCPETNNHARTLLATLNTMQPLCSVA